MLHQFRSNVASQLQREQLLHPSCRERWQAKKLEILCGRRRKEGRSLHDESHSQRMTNMKRHGSRNFVRFQRFVYPSPGFSPSPLWWSPDLPPPPPPPPPSPLHPSSLPPVDPPSLSPAQSPEIISSSRSIASFWSFLTDKLPATSSSCSINPWMSEVQPKTREVGLQVVQQEEEGEEEEAACGWETWVLQCSRTSWDELKQLVGRRGACGEGESNEEYAGRTKYGSCCFLAKPM